MTRVRERCACSPSPATANAPNPMRARGTEPGFAAHDFSRISVHVAAAAAFGETDDSSETAPDVARPLDGPDAGAPRPPVAAPGASPQPNCGFVHNPLNDSLISVRADDPAEFVNKARQPDGTLGLTPASFSRRPAQLDANGKVASVNLELESKIRRPMFAGGMPSSDDRAVIDAIVAKIRTHEEEHRANAVSAGSKAACDVVGKTPAVALATLRKAICDTLPAKQEALDLREGDIEVFQVGGRWTFKTKGVKQNYHEPKCGNDFQRL